MFNKYALLLLSIVLYSNSFVFGQEEYLISGKIQTSNPEHSLSVPVVLMEIKMGEKPTVNPIQQTTSDLSGNFVFVLKGISEGTYYRVSAMLSGQVIGTNPVKFEKTSRKMDVVLELPETVEGLEKLNFANNILVFDLIGDLVRVTDIIIFENRSGAIVDTSKNSFKRTLPPNAMNIKIFDPPKSVNIKLEGNQVDYKFSSPPGRYQIYMTYDLPAGTDSIDLLNPLPPTVKQMEIIVPKNSFQVKFDPIFSQVISRDKNFNNQDFLSQSIHIREGVSSVRVYLSGLPMTQKNLFYPATILLILLLSGLFWYLKNNLPSGNRQVVNEG